MTAKATANPTNSSIGVDNPIVLAFSGGLDTSFCIPWLAETYARPVVTVRAIAARAIRRAGAARRARTTPW